MTTLNNLTFMVNLIDKVSGPMGKVMKSIDQASRGFSEGAQKIGYGVAGLAGAAYSVNSLLEPTKEMQRALGEVKSLGVADDTLNKLRDTALKFSTQYGDTASDFVRASYDIQSAIAGLSGDELSAFTQVSGVLAKGTKANVADITNYVGTMYGIFKQNADAMGKAQWVEQMAAKTALAVNIFKSDGKGMADAFKSIGATAANAGITLGEQFAVLGQLQATMSGAEAGTKYRSFLDNVGKAQEELNLKFTDAKGRMLPIVDILGKISKKFGAIDKVAEADLLKKAFGTDEAVALIKLLNNDLSGLKNNISQLNKESSLDSLAKMAEAMTDPWGKMKSGIEATSITIGTELLPTLLPMIDSINATTQGALEWMHANPKLAEAIGLVTLGGFGFIGMLALFSIASGYATIVTTGWRLAMTNIFSPLKNMAMAIWANLPAIWAWIKALFTTPITLANLQAGLTAATARLWAFTSAIFANPMTWWILGITAVIAVVVGAIVYWKEWTTVAVMLWDAIKIGLAETWKLISDVTDRFLNMIGVFSLIDNMPAAWETLREWWVRFSAWIGALNPLAQVVDGVVLIVAGFAAIPQWWDGFKIWLGALNPFAMIGDGVASIVSWFESIKTWWAGFKDWLGTLNPFGAIMSGTSKAISLINGLPGININQISTAPVQTSQPATPRNGGIIKQMSSVMNANKSTTVGEVTVNNFGSPMSGAKLRDELLFAGG